MIKRTYFLSAKVAHNDCSGEYSWWNTNFTTTGWFALKPDELLYQSRALAVNTLMHKVKRDIVEGDIEVLALNKY
jgi:hypothetical protein